MDVNNVPFWQWRGADAFGLGPDAPFPASAEGLVWDETDGALRIARGERAPDLAENEALARSWFDRPSAICDNQGSFAWWDEEAGQLLASGFGLEPVLLTAGLGEGAAMPRPSDMAFADDVAWLAQDGVLVAADMRQRWPAERITSQGFTVNLVSAAPGQDPWVLDFASGRLARVIGSPLPTIARRIPPDDAFVPDEPDPEGLRLQVVEGVSVPASLRPLAMRAGPNGRLAILCWNPGESGELLLYGPDIGLRRSQLAGLTFPFSLAWDGADQLCLLASDENELANRVFAYDAGMVGQSAAPLYPNGRFIPLINHGGHGLCDGDWQQARHMAEVSEPTQHFGLQRLRAISRLAHPRSGSVMIGPIDSGEFDCVWHRFYAEAHTADGCGMRIALAASNQPAVPPIPTTKENQSAWALHLLGQSQPWPISEEPEPQPQWPRAAWCHSASEIAGHSGFLECTREPQRAGLFTCLIQDGRRAVRRVTGRYLYVHVELTGDGQRSPGLHALRVYGNRFSYRDAYLPELYGETLSGPDARQLGAATPPDFLERLIHLMEGPLTEIEGRVAGGWTVSDPESVPNEGLDWLASWTGFEFDDIDPSQKRQKLLCAPHLRRLNGTLAGLNAILELETGGRLLRGGQFDPDLPAPRPGQVAQIELEGHSYRALVLAIADPRSGGQTEVLLGGAITRGALVVLEGFRMRRTFATILGADLADEHDPMLLGMVRSGNSVVGDSLILGSEERADLFVHFASDLPKSAGEEAELAEFYRKLAHRVMVLVRKDDASSAYDQERLLTVARAMAPAHVETSVLPMTRRFIVGAASLVGIDSFLEDPLPTEPFDIDSSKLSEGDVITGTGALDRRSDGPVSMPPIARASGPGAVSTTDGFWLDASASSAARGRNINRYIWTWN